MKQWKEYKLAVCWWTYIFYLVGIHPIYKDIGSIFRNWTKKPVNAILASKCYIWLIFQPLQFCEYQKKLIHERSKIKQVVNCTSKGSIQIHLTKFLYPIVSFTESQRFSGPIRNRPAFESYKWGVLKIVNMGVGDQVKTCTCICIWSLIEFHWEL